MSSDHNCRSSIKYKTNIKYLLFFSFFKCEKLLLFSVLYHCKKVSLGFKAVGLTKQDIWSRAEKQYYYLIEYSAILIMITCFSWTLYHFWPYILRICDGHLLLFFLFVFWHFFFQIKQQRRQLKIRKDKVVDPLFSKANSIQLIQL